MIATLEKANDLIEQQQFQIRELTKKLHSYELKVNMLQDQVEQLLRRVYGRRSEKLDPNQLMFDSLMLEAIEQQASEPLPEPSLTEEPKRESRGAKERRHPGRIPIPEHLERVEIILDIPEEEKVCPETGKPLKKIGEEVSEKLEYRPGKLIVNVYKRAKYLYRQNGIFEREGVEIPRATLSSWTLQTYDAISPLEDVLKKAVLERDVLFTDDSIIPLQVKGNGRVKKARLWSYVGGGIDPPVVVYDFSHDRSKKRPLDFLDGYHGYVHADAYSGYDELFKREGIIEVGCWVHTRRKFDEAVSSRPEEATEVMARIARLYKIEAECSEMTDAERCNIRKQYSKPIIDTIFVRLEELKAVTIPSEPLRKAVNYALNALGRKNWLFAASDRGARATALFLGLIQSCKACDVNPWEYFNDMLRRIMTHSITGLRVLLPDQWKPLS
jgi:transposase